MSRVTMLSVEPRDRGQRLDQYLAGQDSTLSRSRVQDLILAGQALVGGVAVRPSYRVRAGDEIRLVLPPPAPVALRPSPMAFDVLFEDGDMLVLNKPPGVAVHPSPGHQEHTLVHGLLARHSDLPGIGGERRPGIVHRLDLDTSGLLMVAKSERGLLALSAQLQARTVKKGYFALILGTPSDRDGVIDAPIARDPVSRQRMAIVAGGRPARTRYASLAPLNGATLVLAMPETGRTHQIRVHFAAIGHPIAGDRTYGGVVDYLGRQFLHAGLLRFARPEDGAPVEVTAPLAADLRTALAGLVRSSSVAEDDVEGAIDRMLRLGERQFRRLAGAGTEAAQSAEGRA